MKRWRGGRPRPDVPGGEVDKVAIRVDGGQRRQKLIAVVDLLRSKVLHMLILNLKMKFPLLLQTSKYAMVSTESVYFLAEIYDSHSP